MYKCFGVYKTNSRMGEARRLLVKYDPHPPPLTARLPSVLPVTAGEYSRWCRMQGSDSVNKSISSYSISIIIPYNLEKAYEEKTHSKLHFEIY